MALALNARQVPSLAARGSSRVTCTRAIACVPQHRPSRLATKTTLAHSVFAVQGLRQSPDEPTMMSWDSEEDANSWQSAHSNIRATGSTTGTALNNAPPAEMEAAMADIMTAALLMAPATLPLLAAPNGPLWIYDAFKSTLVVGEDGVWAVWPEIQAPVFNPIPRTEVVRIETFNIVGADQPDGGVQVMSAPPGFAVHSRPIPTTYGTNILPMEVCDGLSDKIEDERSRLWFGPQGFYTTTNPATDTVKVSFAVHKRTSPGENLVLAGSHAALGGWDLAAALPLRWTKGHIWRGSVHLPAAIASKIEFKAVLRCGEQAVWEAGGNQRAHIGGGGSTEVELTHVFAA